MIDGLIGGKLYGKPAQRVGQNGKLFVTAKVAAAPIFLDTGLG
jgi:hypothetical protein